MNLNIWAFSEAPPKYQVLSEHGGDEDLVFVIKTADLRYMCLPPLLDLVFAEYCVGDHRPVNDGDYLFVQKIVAGDETVFITAYA